MVHLYIIYNVNPSFLVWHNNTIKNLACIYYPTTSMIQKSAHGLAWPLVKLKLRFWPGLRCSHRLNSGAFKLYMLIAFSFLQTASLWAPISCWLSVRGHLSSLPRGPLWSANPTMEACSFRDSHRISGKINITVLHNRISSCFLSCKLLGRSKSRALPTLRTGSIEGCEH